MADPVKGALRRKLAAAEAAGDTERVDVIRERMAAPADAVVPSPDADVKVEAEDYDSWLVEDLRAEAGDLNVKRGDGQDGEPLKADYIKALKARDKKAAKEAK